MSALARPFDQFDQLTVRQRKSWAEVLLSFDTRNRYEVFDQSGRPVLRVQEVSGGFSGFLARLFLGSVRPFRSEVIDGQTEQVLLRLHRPWRLILQTMTVTDADGTPMGTITQRWSWFRRIYQVESATGERLEIFGPFFRPWTFELRDYGQVVGKISKRWRGLGTELFTEADNFGVELGGLASAELKALAFAATVLIDVVHFESSN